MKICNNWLKQLLLGQTTKSILPHKAFNYFVDLESIYMYIFITPLGQFSLVLNMELYRLNIAEFYIGYRFLDIFTFKSYTLLHSHINVSVTPVNYHDIYLRLDCRCIVSS